MNKSNHVAERLRRTPRPARSPVNHPYERKHLLPIYRTILNPKRIIHGVRWRWLYFRGLTQTRVAHARTIASWKIRRPGKTHKLPGELIVSLTSYPPRFPTLVYTLQCLLNQTIKPDRTILWISDADEHLIPREIRQLAQVGLEIRLTEDIRSYKKIVPTILCHPQAFIVTADDDLYYPRHWLEVLVDGWSGSYNQAVCHRAHKIRYDKNNRPLPYSQWQFEYDKPEESVEIFPTTGGGVLFPPGSLASEVVDAKVFQAICPNADDIWLYFMARRAGTVFKKVGGRRSLIAWDGSQEVALHHGNLALGGNDQQFCLVAEKYGFLSCPYG